MISVSLKPKDLHEKLDPVAIDFTNEFYLLENLVTKLVTLDESGNYLLEAASEISTNSSTQYVFKLKNIYFSNGDKITVEDVKESLKRTINNGSTHSNLKENIQDINSNGDQLTINLKEPNKSFFYYLSMPDFGILHKSQYTKNQLNAGDFSVISSGPFTYTKDDSSFYLKKNPFYKTDNERMPTLVKLLSPFNNNIADLLLKSKIDLGQIGIEDYFKNQKDLNKQENLRFLGTTSDAFTYIYFNNFSINSLNQYQRQWLSRFIFEKFKIPSQFSSLSRKSNQYFPLESKAHVSSEEIDKIYGSFPTKKPINFPQKLIIHTYTTSFKVTIKNLVNELTKLGLDIEIIDDVLPGEYVERMKKGDIDIFLNIMSTDFRMPVEAINFEIFSPDAKFKDLTGEIKKLFIEYQKSTDILKDEAILKKISIQMLKDCNFIPLFHSAVPYFYNSDTLDMSQLNHLFILNFWKLKTL